MPLGDEIETCDNKLGKIYKKEDKYFVEFKNLFLKTIKNSTKFIAETKTKSNAK